MFSGQKFYYFRENILNQSGGRYFCLDPDPVDFTDDWESILTYFLLLSMKHLNGDFDPPRTWHKPFQTHGSFLIESELKEPK